MQIDVSDNCHNNYSAAHEKRSKVVCILRQINFDYWLCVVRALCEVNNSCDIFALENKYSQKQNKAKSREKLFSLYFLNDAKQKI